MTLTKMFHNVASGEITEVEFTAEEIKQVEADRKINEKKNTTEKAEAEAKAQAKAAAEGKLAALGLTTDDLRALGL